MALDRNAVGRTTGPSEVSWDSRDAMLYALGVAMTTMTLIIIHAMDTAA